ncbi:MAG: phosphoribosylanthranilate isomerase [Thermoguttaceae bacterium]|jgi:phosphoribosylanthranilate isomerase|nr:phosphoribosylanthranilate isomerase [Thermoguttaceae bacterium]
MFRIKICGITSVVDALAAAQAGADAVGLNFFPGSKRFIDHQRAREIVEALPDLVKVGVFVNAGEDDIRRASDLLGLDAIQLHGDEPAGFLARLADLPLVRAFRLDARGFAPIDSYLSACANLGALPRMMLLDACVPGQYGGTGATLDWSPLGRTAGSSDRPPIILAGGLTPANVATAIHRARPAAVDTAGGVEYAPGKKDHTLMAAFVAAARAAFDDCQNADNDG